MIIDIHGHYTTAPAPLGRWREAQTAALTDPVRAPDPAGPVISDDQIRESLETNQLQLMDERGIDVTVFSPRASFMAHHIGDFATSARWAALCNDLYTARMAREHNDANVLSMGGRIVAPALADEIVICFLQTPYQGGRHQRRVVQLGEIADHGSDGDALDTYLDTLVPGITARATDPSQGASS